MKLRTALKICRAIHDPMGNSSRTDGERKRRWNRHCYVRWSRGQILEATRIGRKATRNYPGDQRFPYIPSDEEMHESTEIMGCLWLDIAAEVGIATREQADEKKQQFLIEMADCRPN